MSKDTDINFLKIQTCVLKIHIHCDGCKKKVKKLPQKGGGGGGKPQKGGGFGGGDTGGKDQKAPLMPQQLNLQQQQQLLQQMKGFPQLKDMKLPHLKDMKMLPTKNQKNVKFSLPPADEYDGPEFLYGGGSDEWVMGGCVVEYACIGCYDLELDGGGSASS